jgi:hypothetical protein
MHERSSPFRLLVTVLLMGAVPFCCCNFHSWLSVCAPCEAVTHHAAAEPVAHHHASGAVHEHTSDHYSEVATTPTDGREPDSSPCGPGHKDEDCNCGKQNTLVTVAKTALELPAPVLVAMLSFPAIANSWAMTSLRTFERDSQAPERPSTTLLHLHCALIV